MEIVLAIDFGSTFTKVVAVDIKNNEIIGTGKAFTTIETDVNEGLKNAVDDLYKKTGEIKFTKKLACSSAAGGLKMISCGLVPDLTAKAAKMAASSAGAKVLRNYSYELSSMEQEEIERLDPDIILLSGGIDGGNKDVILHNAEILSKLDGDFFVIIAGNKSVSQEAFDLLEAGGKRGIITENVMPEFNKLNIAPAKDEIRNLFIKNIISAKGLDDAQKILDDDIIPTPLAVFEAAELLSRGTKEELGLGEIMAYDVGGATTDVYSMANGEPSKSNVMLKGFKEPYAKRSVEGDLGMRYSMLSLVEEAGIENICESLEIESEKVENWMAICKKDPSTLADPDSIEKNIDREFAAFAVGISAIRHCGYLETMYSPMGEAHMQTGKDLTGVKWIIGAGGSIINSDKPEYILERGKYSQENFNVLMPLNPKYLIDKKGILSAMGLIGRIDPEAAIRIMKKEFIEV